MSVATATAAPATAGRVLLACAVALQEGHRGPWPFEALVVAAWRARPDLFGLAGFEAQYPDNHRAACHLCGPRGLVGRGWLRRPKRGHYEVAPAGWDEYHRMGDGHS